MTDPNRRFWIAWPPMGIASHPAITYNERTASNYRNMSWRVGGPYVKEDDCSSTP